MNVVQISRLGPEDQPTVREFCFHGIFSPEGRPPPTKAILNEPQIRLYFENWGRAGDIGWKAIRDSHPVGAVWLRLLTGEVRGYGWVDDETPELSISVLPGYRGKGIGTQLLDRLFEATIPRVSLSVTKSNPANLLYQRFGFETVGDDGETLTMVRAVSPI
jgi:ribosomal protein S18 acetylase RimI-like enzyme